MRAEYSISNDKNWMGQREYVLIRMSASGFLKEPSVVVGERK